jgi:arylsulfatase
VPPNFLFFLPDEHRPDWLGSNPDLPLRTPNLDQLAAGGMWFPNAVTPSPLCAPARACLASGLDYAHCGVPDNRVDFPLDTPTYYQSLRDAGYRVGGVGKFDLHKATFDWGWDGQNRLKEWGFTDGMDNAGKAITNRASPELREPFLAHLYKRGLAETHLGDYRQRHSYTTDRPTPLPDDAYCDNWVAEGGLRVLRGFPTGQPWHLQINFPGPHPPLDPTASMAERWEGVDFPPPHDCTAYDRETHVRIRRSYAALIENIDRHVGRFLDAVRERGELENTIVVYSSDHGEMLGDHDLWGKRSYYQPSVGVPFFVSGPGVRRGVRSEALVSLHDVAATFLDYAGLAPLPEMDSKSARPVLEGRTETHREVVTSAFEGWRVTFDGRFKQVERDDAPPLRFDLQRDPWECENLAAVTASA